MKCFPSRFIYTCKEVAVLMVHLCVLLPKRHHFVIVSQVLLLTFSVEHSDVVRQHGIPVFTIADENLSVPANKKNGIFWGTCRWPTINALTAPRVETRWRAGCKYREGLMCAGGWVVREHVINAADPGLIPAGGPLLQVTGPDRTRPVIQTFTAEYHETQTVPTGLAQQSALQPTRAPAKRCVFISHHNKALYYRLQKQRLTLIKCNIICTNSWMRSFFLCTPVWQV